jgi:ABC-type bacteriocin/lantibiotic exporter with double-glycine peptidase domain
VKPVIQEDRTGCGIAASAAIAGISYKQAKRVAVSLGITASDDQLWSDTLYIQRLLARLGRRVSGERQTFRSWAALPDCALLAIKWHTQGDRPFWHWVVWVREQGEGTVLDSRRGLKTHARRDFGRMRPKWYLSVTRETRR